MNTHIDTTAQSAGARLAGIAASAEAVSISLLAEVDETVDSMQGIASIMSGLCRVVARGNEELRKLAVEPGVYIDEDGSAVDAMASAAATLQNFLTKLVRKRTAIDKDNRLKAHHCEALHDAYELATSEVAELVEVIRETRAAIISHDLAAEPRDGVAFESVEALIEDLRKA